MSASQTNNILTRITNFYQANILRGRFILAALIFIFLLIIIRLALPQAIIYNATSWLKEQNIDSTIESVNINILNGTVSLNNAKASRDGAPLFNIGLIDIHWHWTPLSNKTMVVTKVELDNISIDIEKYTDEISIGGVNIPISAKPEKSEPKKEQDDEVTPWGASLGEVVLTNFNICYLQHLSTRDSATKENKNIDYCIKLEKMLWGGTIAYATDQNLLQGDDIPISSTGDFELNGLNITNNRLNKKLLVSASNKLKDVTVTGLKNIQIKQLEMNQLSALHRDDDQHPDTIRFNQVLINDILLDNLNKLSLNQITINKPGLYMVKNNKSQWEFQQWAPSAEDEQKTVFENKQETNTVPFQITINNLAVNKPDFCYLENSTSLYYCFTSDQIKVPGSIKHGAELNITSDVILTNPLVHNHTLKRDLLSLEKLTLSDLKIADLSDIAINKINLSKLNALQRGKKKKDATVAFNELSINDIHYTKNSIAIDTIKLTGLTSKTSVNKDGSLEHSKWFPEEAKTNKKETNAENKEPIKISLNSISVTTNKKLLFSDNSTNPVMTVGLQSLTFNASKLHSSNPKVNSPFKLTAQTIRHSTIDFEGTAQPFADKISLEGEGVLKGFDLRAASPAADKAIGHIIKSGQMDADITLLAKEGVLDSNIALSLYHFNLTSESKKATKELDDKFGLPLNQTLVLLRDKDDSIHLDIPITGDVTNPDFDPMDAIIKATSKAATVTLITFYTPYGLIYAGGNVLFDLATAMDFAPIEFKPASTELTEENKESLVKLSTLMTEKPGIHLTLCGTTNTKDEAILFPELVKPENSDNKKPVKLSKEQYVTLDNIAVKRQVNTKNYLIKEFGITHDRLILCEPLHDSDNDVAGVEITI